MPQDNVQPVRAAGVVVLKRSPPQEVLLLKHKNRWDLPKGHAEEGEDFQETALRETEEETGIRTEDLALDPDFRFELEYVVESRKYGKRPKRVVYFLAFVDNRPDIRLTEHIGFDWFGWPVDKIQKQTIDPLLAAVKQHLEGQGGMTL